MKWSRSKVIVTGGAGFIGSNIADRLLRAGAQVTAVDKPQGNAPSDTWKAKLARLDRVYAKNGIKKADLSLVDLESDRLGFRRVAKGYDVVFHLGAVFGGREFVDTRQADCSAMLSIDHNVISASYEAGVDRVHFSSSACVYPDSINRPGYLLKESDILSTGEGWKSADNLYGFAKLMGEMQLLAFHSEKGLKTSAARYLTVYGPGELDGSHAIAALVEKALDRTDPYVVWGSGLQERGFTYVDDIAAGSILAAEKITDGTAVNLGWDKRYTIKDVAERILRISGHRPSKVIYDRSKPEGPFSRALDISRAKELLGWVPKVDLEEGLTRTIDWHKASRGPAPAIRRPLGRK
ncbi:MAG: NAD-dependent epimerase/dehydratase family protein [Nitrososphaerota archaeon]|nr:NAD-dependent epimerase/dehydratase family protein [Nitrososphaerota archaeon]